MSIALQAKMSETVGTSEQTEQIQNYIEGAAPSGSGGDGSAEYYTIEEKQIAGNILIAQGETSGQAENVYMVMDGQDQQFIMISYDQSGRPTGPVAEHVLVAPSEGEATTVTVVEPAEVVATRSGRPKRQTRGMLRAMQFKEETNDISVYDFTDMNVPARGGGGAEAGQEDAPSGEQDKGAGSATEDEDTDADYVKPAPAPKRIGRPPKAVTAKRSKAAASSSAAVVVGNAANASVSGNVHVCTYCNYTSNKRYLLSRHLKSHSEDRPHKCGICERGFKVCSKFARIVMYNLIFCLFHRLWPRCRTMSTLTLECDHIVASFATPPSPHRASWCVTFATATRTRSHIVATSATTLRWSCRS